MKLPLFVWTWVVSANWLLNGLLHYYEFENDVTDSHWSNNGTDNGTSDIAGKILRGRDFDWINDNVWLTTITLTWEFTVNLWYNDDTASALWMFLGNTWNNIKLWFNAWKYFVRVLDSGSNDQTITPWVTSGNWGMFTLTRNSSDVVTLYENWVSQWTMFWWAAQSGNFTLNEIWCTTFDSQCFDGKLDEVYIANVEKDSTAISALYNGWAWLPYSNFTS